MNKLVRANFARLWKNKIFWLAMFCMFALGVYVIVGTLIGNAAVPTDALKSPDTLLLISGSVIGIITSFFIAFFIGTEYSDGTIRNKIVVGHSRYAVYFANWIVCVAAALMMHILYILIVSIAGSIVIGSFVIVPLTMVKILIVSFVSVSALTSFFLMIAMLIHSKPFTVAVLILASFFLLFYQNIVADRLSTPKYFDAYSWTDEKGVSHKEPREKNPTYPTGLKRRYYNFMYDFLPGSQMMQVSKMINNSSQSNGLLTKKNNTDMLIFAGYSTLIILLSSGVGILFFKRKDLK